MQPIQELQRQKQLEITNPQRMTKVGCSCLALKMRMILWRFLTFLMVSLHFSDWNAAHYCQICFLRRQSGTVIVKQTDTKQSCQKHQSSGSSSEGSQLPTLLCQDFWGVTSVSNCYQLSLHLSTFHADVNDVVILIMCIWSIKNKDAVSLSCFQ